MLIGKNNIELIIVNNSVIINLLNPSYDAIL